MGWSKESNVQNRPNTKHDWIWYNLFRALQSYLTNDNLGTKAHLHNAMVLAKNKSKS
jgi:hypothetical protein